MQQLEHSGEPEAAGRRRVEAVVHTLAALGCRGETLAEVAHDARNMVTALGLYCDLLEEPGVLAVPFAHYGNELRLVAAASRRLVEKLVALDAEIAVEPQAAALGGSPSGGWTSAGLPDPGLQRALERSFERNIERNLDSNPDPSLDLSLDSSLGQALAQGSVQLPELRDAGSERVLSPGFSMAPGRSRRWESIFTEPIRNLAAEVLANRNLLAALAGPGIAVTVDCECGAHPVRLTAEDLTRMLVNLAKNAAEAMPSGGRIHIALSERPGAGGLGASTPARLVMAVEDTGPGIPEGDLEKIFESGFTTHIRNAAPGGWPSAHRGLGLAIIRSIVEAAGGRIVASNRAGSGTASMANPAPGGARFEIELPVRAI